MSNSNSGKKVLVACPTLGLDKDPNTWLFTFISILNNIRAEGLGSANIFPYRMGWYQANNDIWNVALLHGFDYILRLDDDIWDAPQDAFSKLLAADKDVIGAAYPSQRFPYFMMAVNNTEKVSLLEAYDKNICCLRSIVPAEHDSPIVKVDQIGFGMTLIKVEPFRYLPRPLFQGPNHYPDDTYFAQLCQENGIEQYVHTEVKLAHKHVTFKNNGYLFNAAVIENHKEEEKKEATCSNEAK